MQLHHSFKPLVSVIINACTRPFLVTNSYCILHIGAHIYTYAFTNKRIVLNDIPLSMYYSYR